MEKMPEADQTKWRVVDCTDSDTTTVRPCDTQVEADAACAALIATGRRGYVLSPDSAGARIHQMTEEMVENVNRNAVKDSGAQQD